MDIKDNCLVKVFHMSLKRSLGFAKVKLFYMFKDFNVPPYDKHEISFLMNGFQHLNTSKKDQLLRRNFNRMMFDTLNSFFCQNEESAIFIYNHSMNIFLLFCNLHASDFSNYRKFSYSIWTGIQGRSYIPTQTISLYCNTTIYVKCTENNVIKFEKCVMLLLEILSFI
ncbi:hypothetical protein T11_10183 [Trichinella zimbabwensis]|uniref:Uncharacterized protein n=1 Tax=Trichinella zimbabwensis TaxID=268475 RepID=A0A0V1HHT3_9BILA|nr:hypothetical protein T11_10183 [Trichinella zimbabwensis]